MKHREYWSDGAISCFSFFRVMFRWMTLFLTVFYQPAVSGLCQKSVMVGKRPMDPAFCIREATRLNPSSLVAFSNGSCHFYNACPDSTKTPLFALLRPSRTYILLRTHTNTSANPIDVLTESKTAAVQLGLRTLKPTESFKSPLFDILNPSLEFIRILLLNEAGGAAVNITFKVNSLPAISKVETWFKKSNLVSAHPWKLQSLKNGDVTFIANDDLRPQSFMIFVKNNGCDFFGFMCVFSATPFSCEWEKLEKEPPSYYWGIQRGGAARFQGENFKAATQFVMEGVFRNTEDRVYVKASN